MDFRSSTSPSHHHRHSISSTNLAQLPPAPVRCSFPPLHGDAAADVAGGDGGGGINSNNIHHHHAENKPDTWRDSFRVQLEELEAVQQRASLKPSAIHQNQSLLTSPPGPGRLSCGGGGGGDVGSSSSCSPTRRTAVAVPARHSTTCCPLDENGNAENINMTTTNTTITTTTADDDDSNKNNTHHHQLPPPHQQQQQQQLLLRQEEEQEEDQHLNRSDSDASDLLQAARKSRRVRFSTGGIELPAVLSGSCVSPTAPAPPPPHVAATAPTDLDPEENGNESKPNPIDAQEQAVKEDSSAPAVVVATNHNANNDNKNDEKVTEITENHEPQLIRQGEQESKEQSQNEHVPATVGADDDDSGINSDDSNNNNNVAAYFCEAEVVRRFRFIDDVKSLSSSELNKVLTELDALLMVDAARKKEEEKEEKDNTDNEVQGTAAPATMEAKKPKRSVFPRLHSEKVSFALGMLKRLGCELTMKHNPKKNQHATASLHHHCAPLNHRIERGGGVNENSKSSVLSHAKKSPYEFSASSYSKPQQQLLKSANRNLAVFAEGKKDDDNSRTKNHTARSRKATTTTATPTEEEATPQPPMKFGGHHHHHHHQQQHPTAGSFMESFLRNRRRESGQRRPRSEELASFISMKRCNNKNDNNNNNSDTNPDETKDEKRETVDDTSATSEEQVTITTETTASNKPAERHGCGGIMFDIPCRVADEDTSNDSERAGAGRDAAAAQRHNAGAREIFSRVRSAVRDGSISRLPASELDFFLDRKNFAAHGALFGGVELPRLKKDKIAWCIRIVEKEGKS